MTRSPASPSVVASEAGAPRPDAARGWARAVELTARIGSIGPDQAPSAAYRFGDVVVELFTQDDSVLRSFSQLYAECGVSPESASALPRLHH